MSSSKPWPGQEQDTSRQRLYSTRKLLDFGCKTQDCNSSWISFKIACLGGRNLFHGDRRLDGSGFEWGVWAVLANRLTWNGSEVSTFNFWCSKAKTELKTHSTARIEDLQHLIPTSLVFEPSTWKKIQIPKKTCRELSYCSSQCMSLERSHWYPCMFCNFRRMALCICTSKPVEMAQYWRWTLVRAARLSLAVSVLACGQVEDHAWHRHSWIDCEIYIIYIYISI